jgi:hypothetical protein
MIIYAAQLFTCAHQYVVVDKLFICHQCRQVRAELPISKVGRKSLIFFPQTAETELEAQVG